MGLGDRKYCLVCIKVIEVYGKSPLTETNIVVVVFHFNLFVCVLFLFISVWNLEQTSDINNLIKYKHSTRKINITLFFCLFLCGFQDLERIKDKRHNKRHNYINVPKNKTFIVFSLHFILESSTDSIRYKNVLI